MDALFESKICQHIARDIFVYYVLPRLDLVNDLLIVEAEAGRLENVAALIEGGGTSSEAREEALVRAAHADHTSMVIQLVDAGGANPSVAAPVAFARMNFQMIRSLIARGADMSKFDNADLMCVLARLGYADVIKYMLNACEAFTFMININTIERAMMMAAAHGQVDVVDCLRNSNLLSCDWPLAYIEAVKNNQIEVVKQLDFFMNHHIADEAMWRAIDLGHAAIVKHVLDFYYKRQCFWCREGGRCGWPETKAMVGAAHYGKIDMVRMILARGNVNFGYRLNYGNFEHTALEAARAAGHHDIEQLLIENGANAITPRHVAAKIASYRDNHGCAVM